MHCALEEEEWEEIKMKIYYVFVIEKMFLFNGKSKSLLDIYKHRHRQKYTRTREKFNGKHENDIEND